MKLYIDLETNMEHTDIWCAAYAVDDEPAQVTRDSNVILSLVKLADEIINHNLIGFDAPLLDKLWNIRIPFKKMTDTLVMSRLYNPSIDKGHSLDSWGQRLHCPKGDFRDYDAGYSEEMAEYAKQDIEVTRKLYKHLKEQMELMEFTDDSILLEHQVAYVINKQVRHGVCFELIQALELKQQLDSRMLEIEKEMQERFPPIVTERWSEKTGKQLKDDVEVFNVGSRQQIAKRLQSIGVKFKQVTEGGQAKVDETILESIDKPEAKMIAEYLMLQKRVGMIDSWIKACTIEGKIHGRVITNGAVTGRMTHQSPNLAQIPAVGAPYGKECRKLFVPLPGKVLVGIDASALELCMLAHFMNNEAYIKSVTEGKKEDGTDVHTLNQKLAGLKTRDQAKTFIYAFLYGAGAAKIGSILGGGYKEGKNAIDMFMARVPPLAKLKKKVDRVAEIPSRTFRGLDGRRMRIRSAHAALNTLLQGAGAIVMKKALVILHNKIVTAKLDANFVLNVHDEWQIEVIPEQAEKLSQLGIDAIREAGEALNLKCPLTGEAKIGKDWSETH